MGALVAAVLVCLVIALVAVGARRVALALAAASACAAVLGAARRGGWPQGAKLGGGRGRGARGPARDSRAPRARSLEAHAPPSREAREGAEFSPPLKVITYHVRAPDGKPKALGVVRDDLLPVGTKQRAVLEYLRRAVAAADATGAPRVTTVLYTAPYNGYSGTATALGAASLGLGCRLILSLEPFGGGAPATSESVEASPPVRLAREQGARVEFAPNWRALVAAGKAAAASPGVLWLPLGMDEPEFDACLSAAIAAAASRLGTPKRIWTAGGSGVISMAIARAFPAAEIVVVPIVVEAAPSARLAKAAAARPNLRIENRHAPVVGVPYPTVRNYDSRAWDAAVAWGGDGDWVWNVAGEGPPPPAPGEVRVSAVAAELPRLPVPLPGASPEDRERWINAAGGPLALAPAAVPLPAEPSPAAPLPPGVALHPPRAGVDPARCEAELGRLFADPERARAFVRKETDADPSFLFFERAKDGASRLPWLGAVLAGLRAAGCPELAACIEAHLAGFLAGLGVAPEPEVTDALRLFIEKDAPGDGYRWHVDKLAGLRGAPIYIVALGGTTAFDFAPLVGGPAAGPAVRVEVGGGGAAFSMDGAARYEWAHAKPHGGGVRYNVVLEFGRVLPGATELGRSELFGLPIWSS